MLERYSVVDLNSGLGGRPLAFLEAGFSVLAAAEDDISKREISRSILPGIPVVPNPSELADLSGTSSADVILAHFSLTLSSRPSIFEDITAKTSILSELILSQMPKMFLLQAPAAALKSQAFQPFATAVYRRYYITYQVCDGMQYSGLPVNTRQLFLVGVRPDIMAGKPFQFPAAQYEKACRAPSLEPANDIDPWYRRLPASAVFPSDSSYPYYYRNFGKGIVGSTDINVNRTPDVYVLDPIGPRRLTHQEIGRLKGLDGYAFNQWPNRFKMYQMLRHEPDVHVVKAIARSIYDYLESIDLRSGSGKWSISGVEQEHHKDETKQDVTPALEKAPPASKPKPVKQEAAPKKPAIIIRPRSKITHLQIDHLKGLDNLEISFNKRLTAIMGANGAGKSTILHALACMFAPVDQGEDRKFNYFFTPNPDASWQGSRFRLTYLDEVTQLTTTRIYQKITDRWSPKYSTRPKRDVFFLGIETGIPEIERERQTSFIDYHTDEMNDRLSKKVRTEAAQILNKDYEYLTKHKTKKKELFGIHTQSNITYSSLSMGAGEQRLLRILMTVHNAPPYSLVLIDEIDLLLHSEAQKRLIEVLSGIAEQRKHQIIFTTHSLVIGALTDLVDIRYLFRAEDSVAVYDRITPYIVSGLQRDQKQPLTIYVEDDLGEAIVSFVAQKLGMSRCVKVQDIGSASNAFTVAAGIVLMGESLDDLLIVLDGDVYKTDEEKKAMVGKALTGTERSHKGKVDAAAAAIVQFGLPCGFKPEKYIHTMLIQTTGDDELIDYAKEIQAVSEDHEWLNRIIEELHSDRKVALYRIINQVSTHAAWNQYVAPVQAWLLNKQKEYQLYSFSHQEALA